jgi:hypothetical protein
MNINARAVPSPGSGPVDDRISLTIRPSYPVPGDYSFVTTSDSLRRFLRRTDLPSTVLERFETRLYQPRGATLSAVELSENALTEIGYFVD